MINSSFYFRYVDEIQNRLDENYNSPKFEIIPELLEKSKFSRIVPIGHEDILTDMTSGRTPKGIEYFENGIPFLGASNISIFGIDFESSPKITESEHCTRLSNSQIKKGNLLISMAGTIGRCHVLNENFECNCNQAVAILNLNKDFVIPEYLMYYLNSKIGQLFFDKLQHISDQPNINLDEIKGIEIILPDKDEQKKIIKRCKALLKKTTKINDKILETKSNFDKPMRELSKRNPQINKNLFQTNFYSLSPDDLESERTRVDYVANHPSFEWVRDFRKQKNMQSLEQIINKSRFKYGISKSAKSQSNIGFLNVQHLHFEGRIIFEPKTYVDDAPSTKILAENDIIIARTGHTLGKAALISKEYDGFTFGSFCIRFSLSTPDFLPDFVVQYINSVFGQSQIMMLKTGSGKNNINKEQIEDIRIPTISKPKQREILKEYKKLLNNLAKLEFRCKESQKEFGDTISKLLFK